MGAKHAFLSLAYLVGAALLFSVVRAEFWKEKTPEAEHLEQYHNVPGFESFVIEIAILSNPRGTAPTLALPALL